MKHLPWLHGRDGVKSRRNKRTEIIEVVTASFQDDDAESQPLNVLLELEIPVRRQEDLELVSNRPSEKLSVR